MFYLNNIYDCSRFLYHNIHVQNVYFNYFIIRTENYTKCNLKIILYTVSILKIIWRNSHTNIFCTKYTNSEKYLAENNLS